MKRFWQTTTLHPEADHLTIRLDGRPMRLPGGPLLALRHPPLAEAIAAEWQALPADFTAEHVPLTRIAGTAQERIAPDPAPTIAALARYGAHDLLCYRAATPEALAARQARLWQPWLDWAATTHGAALCVTHTVLPIAQPPEALAALQRALAAQPVPALAALGILVPALGSLVLGLAVAAAALPPDTAHDLAILDELFQSEQWGTDPAAESRRTQLRNDILVAARFIALTAG